MKINSVNKFLLETNASKLIGEEIPKLDEDFSMYIHFEISEDTKLELYEKYGKYIAEEICYNISTLLEEKLNS